MPICCEPGQRYPIVLDGDKGKDPEPTFWCRHLSARKFREMTHLGQQMAQGYELDNQLDAMAAAIDMALCDWENLTDCSGRPIEYAPGLIMDLLTLGEAAELIEKIAAGQRLSGAAAKKSGSPSPSDGDSTAAAGGRVDAATAPAPPSR